MPYEPMEMEVELTQSTDAERNGTMTETAFPKLKITDARTGEETDWSSAAKKRGTRLSIWRVYRTTCGPCSSKWDEFEKAARQNWRNLSANTLCIDEANRHQNSKRWLNAKIRSGTLLPTSSPTGHYISTAGGSQSLTHPPVSMRSVPWYILVDTISETVVESGNGGDPTETPIISSILAPFQEGGGHQAHN